MDLARLGPLLWRSVVAPGPVARDLIPLRPGRGILWMALSLVTVLSVLLVALTQWGTAMVLPLGPDRIVTVTPMTYAVILGSSLVILVFAIRWAGAALGGQGDLDGALVVVIWIELLAIAIRMVQTVLLAVFAPLAGLVAILGLAILIWVFLNFINVLHRFDSIGRSLLTLVLAVLGIGLGLGLILAVIQAVLVSGSSA